MWSAYLLIIAALAIQLEIGEAAGMRYRDASTCVDPASFMSCRHRARESRIDCVSERCYGTEDPCTKVCNVDATCMREKCNALQSKCHRPCECAEAQDIIDCTATSCWNEVYSCEYGVIWDTCPKTKPFLITADYWSKYLLGPLDWDACAPYLQQYDCAGTLGFGAAAAGGTRNFYEPGNTPKNGTGILTNTGGVISTPVSGSSFTWTLGSTTHPVTAAASSTATPSATREFKATACEGAQKTGGGESIAAVHLRPGILLAGALIGLWAAWVGFWM
ncbi:hypothetical protein BDV24DRAFT_155077 [Aspergillus arachidicola]|uniref:Uncharacterized protein n=1 Tax=Aspergillus arachidicola TaxID=656916 RepID=A0A5N6XV94_9EURO|nr:hypothetical protein BDV24DRAFT_155077 [Aspergillus arachidicola]